MKFYIAEDRIRQLDLEIEVIRELQKDAEIYKKTCAKKVATLEKNGGKESKKGKEKERRVQPRRQEIRNGWAL